jgi:hypothetical protein
VRRAVELTCARRDWQQLSLQKRHVIAHSNSTERSRALRTHLTNEISVSMRYKGALARTDFASVGSPTSTTTIERQLL